MSSSHFDSPVLIVGAGPVGLSLALGLARRGVHSVLVEKHSSTSEYSKAPGIHARTLEIFSQWGIAERVLEEALFLRSLTAYSARTGEPVLTMPVEELNDECRFAGLCILEQGQTERLLLEEVRATGLCDVRFGQVLLDLQQDDTGVLATIRSGDREYAHRARYLVGCDGADSTVRHRLGLSLEGITYPLEAILADVRFGDGRADLPFPRLAADEERVAFGLKLESGNWRIVSGVPANPDRVEAGSPVPRELVDRLVRLIWGPGDYECVWSSHFRLHCRCAPRFRRGRVLLAGDAAHLNSPVGAQGMNAGIHDVHNLAWKLAAILAGGDEERLLESYHQERHDLVTREVNSFTDRATRAVFAPRLLRLLALGLARTAAGVRPLRRPLMRRLTMLAGSYRQSPLFPARGGPAGERVPDVELQGLRGSSRLHPLLGLGPALLFLDHPPVEVDPAFGIPTIPIGRDGWIDPSGLLAYRFGECQVLVVRPDHFLGWAGRPESRAELEQAITAALGRR
ncbi:MAG: FAD-dependent monooxygenase [Armatimonadota bacterium]